MYVSFRQYNWFFSVLSFLLYAVRFCPWLIRHIYSKQATMDEFVYSLFNLHQFFICIFVITIKIILPFVLFPSKLFVLSRKNGWPCLNLRNKVIKYITLQVTYRNCILFKTRHCQNYVLDHCFLKNNIELKIINKKMRLIKNLQLLFSLNRIFDYYVYIKCVWNKKTFWYIIRKRNIANNRKSNRKFCINFPLRCSHYTWDK